MPENEIRKSVDIFTCMKRHFTFKSTFIMEIVNKMQVSKPSQLNVICFCHYIKKKILLLPETKLIN